jgi:hypothetical protein
MRRFFCFWSKCTKVAANGSSAFANDLSMALRDTRCFGHLLVSRYAAGRRDDSAGPSNTRQHGDCARGIWSVGFFVRLLNTPVKLYHEQKDDVSKLTAELETVKLRRREIEAHSSLLKEQLDESRRQNSPLQRVAREQQGQQIKAALDPEFQKQGWLMALTREYISSHHNVSSAIVTGTELPPTEWMNRRLRELRKPWRIPTDGQANLQVKFSDNQEPYKRQIEGFTYWRLAIHNSGPASAEIALIAS